MFFKIGVLKNFANFPGKHLRDSKYRCFPVKFAKFLRALFFTEHLGGLLLQKSVLKNFSIFAEKYQSGKNKFFLRLQHCYSL